MGTLSATQAQTSSGIASTPEPKRRLRIKLALFVVSFAVSMAAFVAFDYYYTQVSLPSTAIHNPNGLCFSRDAVRGFAFEPDCSCTRRWLGSSYEFKTNSLGFRDESIREVPATDARPRILILGASASEGMTDWPDSVIGRVARDFPQYDFLNGSVEGYSPSNYLNTERMVSQRGVDFDEAIVFLDIADVQNEAAFFHDKDSSGAVGLPGRKASESSAYSNARLGISDHLLLTNDVFQFFEKTLVGLGWYHLDMGHGGNEFDLERSAWTYRKVSDTESYEIGYAPLGVEGGIAKEKAKMDILYRELRERNIPLSVVVSPWPAQLAHDNVDSREVRIWREWCQGKCKRFVDLFPAFFALKSHCPPLQPGCWYLNDFVFGDVHYNAAGDAVFADVLTQSLQQVPATKRRLSMEATAASDR